MTTPEHLPSTAKRPENETFGGWGVLARLGWMLFGPVALFVTVLGISKRPEWHLGVRDAVFVAVLLATLWVRRLDALRFRGTTANGAPSTPDDLRRHAALLLMVSGAGWAIAQSVQL